MYYATEKEMEKMDMLAVKHGLQISQMMELAGWRMLAAFEKMNISKNQSVLVVAGRGNKGGDGLSAARHLANYGWKVSVVLVSSSLKKDPTRQLALLRAMKMEILSWGKAAERRVATAPVIVDALIGYHLQGVPRGNYKKAIGAINQSAASVISYDIPSGMDATTGACQAECVKSEATLTLALPKRAFSKPLPRKTAGRLFVADIGIPALVYEAINKGARPSFESNGLCLL